MAAKDNDDRKDDQDGDINLDMSQAAVKKMIADAASVAISHMTN